MTGGGADDAPPKCGIESFEAVNLDGESLFADLRGIGASSATSGLAGEDELRQEFLEFDGPAGFLLTSEFSQVGEGLVDAGVLLAEDREHGVPDAVAGEGLVGVGGVFAPGLVALAQVGAEVVAAGVEERAKDFAGASGGCAEFQNGTDGAEAFEPGSAEELHEDGFGLVVEGVGREDFVDFALGEELGEEGVAEVAGGFFEGLFVLGGVGSGVGAVEMERDCEAVAEVFDEALVGFGFFGTEGVVDVDGGEADAEGVPGQGVGGVGEEEQGGGVGSAGYGYGDAVAGRDGDGG